MERVDEFLQMGGYALYVWSSYGLTLVVLALNVILPRARERKLIARLSRRSTRRNLNANESETP